MTEDSIHSRGRSAPTLVKYLVAAGAGSRRASAGLVMAGRVQINGRPAGSLAAPVKVGDRVTVDGREVSASRSTPTYLLLHKPDGYLTTVRDDQGRPTVMDLVPREMRVPGLVPVGRLDFNTSGLLLLTNDGDLAYRLTHPRYEVEKEYVAVVSRPLMPEQLKRLVSGIRLPDGLARAVTVIPLTRPRAPGTGQKPVRAGQPARVGLALPPQGKMRYGITLIEGQNREIRLMFQALGHRVLELRRVRMGIIRLGSLAPGQLRRLSPAEVQRLQELVVAPEPTPGLTAAAPVLQYRRRPAPRRIARPITRGGKHDGNRSVNRSKH